MTAHTGLSIHNQLGVTYDPAITLNLEEFDLSVVLDRAIVVTDPIYETKVKGAALTFPNIAQTGVDTNSFFDDFYNRIHIIPNAFSFGTLVAIDTKTFEVWNSFVDQNLVLDAVSGPTPTQSGVTVTTDTLPSTFHPFESKEYSIVADVVGPPDIGFTFTFDFTSPYDLDITTTGTRVSLWGEMPQKEWQETYEWLTNILESYSGKKQFISLRNQPRRVLTHHYSVLSHQERGRIDNKIRASMANNYAVPMWSQFKKLTQDTSVSGTFIYIDTARMDIEVGSFILLWNNDTQYEAGVIKSIDASYIELERGVDNEYLINALCAPLVLCYLPKEINQSMLPLNKTNYSIKFKAKAGVSIASADLSDTYDNGTDDLDIFIDRSIILSSNTQSSVHKAKYTPVDNITGVHLIDYSFNHSIGMHKVTRLFHTREDAWNFRAWLQKMNGKQGAFWLPNFNATFITVGTIASTSTIVKISDIELTDVFNGTPFVNELGIILKDGTQIFRTIVSVGKNAPNEDILLDATVGTEFTADTVDRIGLIHKVGILTDNLTFNFKHDGLSSVSFDVEELLQ